MLQCSVKCFCGVHFYGGASVWRRAFRPLLHTRDGSAKRRATRALIDTMTSDGGGYILAASHTIAPETPMDNIFAMYHEAGLPRELIFDTAAGVR